MVGKLNFYEQLCLQQRVDARVAIGYVAAITFFLATSGWPGGVVPGEECSLRSSPR